MQITRNAFGKIVSSIRKTRSLKNAASVHSGHDNNVESGRDGGTCRAMLMVLGGESTVGRTMVEVAIVVAMTLVLVLPCEPHRHHHSHKHHDHHRRRRSPSASSMPPLTSLMHTCNRECFARHTTTNGCYNFASTYNAHEPQLCKAVHAKKITQHIWQQ